MTHVTNSRPEHAGLPETTSRENPMVITDRDYMFPAFFNGRVLPGKKPHRLPAMGWNSWNAFGCGNTESLTRAMADKIVELGLKDLGYEYLVLDDGCYRSTRVDGKLVNNEVKFPGGFRALSDYIHDKGLKFGMYNDVGVALCSGDQVGTCGFEDVDAKAYTEWGVDFLKVDNCYYLWDNATFSDGANARFTYAPNIRSIHVSGNGFSRLLSAVGDGTLTGNGASKNINGDFVTGIGTIDGTNIDASPGGVRSGELEFTVAVPAGGQYSLTVNYASGQEAGTGCWLQVAVGDRDAEERYFDDLLPATDSPAVFAEYSGITVKLKAGENKIRLMNHRRQENTLYSYAVFCNALNRANPDHDILLSICEWGKTQPQNWGYKIGSSWRILNDICFSVGADGSSGNGEWMSNNTASITSQYNKAVIMDEYAGPDRGWNDPDMLVIGMDGITQTMGKTHMSMWCMMNAPLMLGLDLRRVALDDQIHRIIANADVIGLNQDALAVQAKRIYCSKEAEHPDTAYITNNSRVDILAKPLADGDVALCFINLDTVAARGKYTVTVEKILEYIGSKMRKRDEFYNARTYRVKDLWTKETYFTADREFSVENLEGCDSVTIRITPDNT